MRRCRNPKDANYRNYGGRGIFVCREWWDYKAFRNDITRLIGPRLPGMTLDRIDVNKGYEPENVRWLTQKGQTRNTRRNHFVEFNGRKLCIKEWSEVLGIPVTALNYRIGAGWPVERMLTEPVNKKFRGL